MSVKPPAELVCENISKVCDALEGGSQSVREACRVVDVPHTTILRWIDQAERYGIGDDLLDRYARARDAIVDSLSDELESIASGKNRPSGTDDNVAVARDRLHIDALKWKLCKLMPRTMGEKVTHQGDAENPVVTKDVTDDRTRAKAILAMLRAAQEKPSGE